MCVLLSKNNLLHMLLLIFHHHTDCSSGYGMAPNGKGTKGALNGSGQKGGVLIPEMPSAAPEREVTPQRATTQGMSPVVPDPTSGIVVMVTREKYHKLPSPVPQAKSYKHPSLEATVEPIPVIPQGKDPKPAAEATPEPAVTLGPAPAVTETHPGPEGAEEHSQGKYPEPGSLSCPNKEAKNRCPAHVF